MENPIKMDDLRVPLFLETPKYHQSPPDSWRLGAHPVSLAVLQPRVLVSCQLLLKLLDLKLRLTNMEEP